MKTFAIGDIQGCYKSLKGLLAELPSPCRIWTVGDLVNRGPDSLKVLRWAMREQITSVLGNHELHLLARAAGHTPSKKNDTLEAILRNEAAADLIDWVRTRPFLHLADGVLMVHAGLHPAWTVEQASELANELETALRRSDWQAHLLAWLGPAPVWTPMLRGIDRQRAALAYFTRVRAIYPDGSMHRTYDGPLAELPEDCTPWFAAPTRAWAGQRIVSGHWAALGRHQTDDVDCIDTGCVWGRTLSALELQTRTIISSPSELR